MFLWIVASSNLMSQCHNAEGWSTVNLHHHDKFINLTVSCVLQDLETICYLKRVQCAVAVKFSRLSAGSWRNVLAVFWKLSLSATSWMDVGNPRHIWITWLWDFAHCLLFSHRLRIASSAGLIWLCISQILFLRLEQCYFLKYFLFLSMGWWTKSRNLTLFVRTEYIYSVASQATSPAPFKYLLNKYPYWIF
jgi:hypothetical protein